MPIGTEAPNLYPANKGPHTSTGAKYAGMEARADKVLDLFLLERQDDFTLVATAPAVGDFDIEVDATHTIAVGDMIELHEADVYFQALVTTVVVDTITLDTPIPYAFTVAGALGLNGPRNAAVDGSGAGGVLYECGPPAGQVWDITKMVYYIEGDTAAMTHSLFGDIAAIAKGCVTRVKRSAAKYEVIHNAKANIDFMDDTNDFLVRPDMTALSFGMTVFRTFGNESASGAMIRLNGDLGERLEFLIQDNIAALVLVKAKAQGYFLDDE